MLHTLLVADDMIYIAQHFDLKEMLQKENVLSAT